MFEFRIIDTMDGNQIIDRNLKTSYDALTAVQMMEYIEIDAQLSFIDRMERRARSETDYERRATKNLLYKVACLCGWL